MTKNWGNEEAGLPKSLIGQVVECQTCQHPFQIREEDADTVKFQGKRSAEIANMVYLDWTVPCPRCLNPVVITETSFS